MVDIDVLKDIKTELAITIPYDTYHRLFKFISSVVDDNIKMSNQLTRICDLVIEETDRNLNLDLFNPYMPIFDVAEILGQKQFKEVYQEQLELLRKEKNKNAGN